MFETEIIDEYGTANRRIWVYGTMFETEIIDEYGTANRRIWDALIIL